MSNELEAIKNVQFFGAANFVMLLAVLIMGFRGVSRAIEKAKEEILEALAGHKPLATKEGRDGSL